MKKILLILALLLSIETAHGLSIKQKIVTLGCIGSTLSALGLYFDTNQTSRIIGIFATWSMAGSTALYYLTSENPELNQQGEVAPV